MELEKNQIPNLVSFFRIVCNLKRIKRSGWIHKSNIGFPESVADHSYSVCMMSMVLSEIMNLDIEHIVKMVNIHDLAESLVGDHMPDEITSEEKELLEDKAMKEIISKLPNSLQEKYLDIWNEYNDNITVSAKFVHNMDKLEMALQAKEYEFEGYSKESLQIFLKSATDYISNDKFDLVFQILQTINDDSNRI
ncbi:MAG TPA: HD domain-containing protein [Nitrososphaeraceae archaeon]|jgi:putative hydrolase of HD superfamily|nr:HD domain-containing protein [Nitrososphaeraceae archaeon]